MTDLHALTADDVAVLQAVDTISDDRNEPVIERLNRAGLIIANYDGLTITPAGTWALACQPTGDPR